MTLRPSDRTDTAAPFTWQELAPARASLRLAVVTETYPPEINGVASTLARFVGGLVERGHTVRLLRPRQPGDAPTASAAGSAGDAPELLFRGLAIPNYPNLRMGLPARRALTTHWMRHRPDLVHIATEGPLGWSALQAALRLRIPVSSDFRTNFDAYSAHYRLGWLRSPIGAYLRRFHNRTAVTMVPTREIQDRLARAGFLRLAVVGRGVDTRLFDPARRSEALRRQWGVAPGAPVVLHVGRLAAEKNLAMLGDAFAAMRRRQPDARLVLVGDGPARTALAARFPEAIFAGMRSGEDLAAHYASADVFLFPSLTETFGNVTLEAMASGLAVVAYDCAAAGCHLTHEQTGLLASPDEPARLLELACALATDPARIERLGRAARQSALGIGWDRRIGEFESILLQTAATHPAG
jgi:glycosyltransferase involved in cell wall biosynthesis